MKAHVGVDASSGLVHTAGVTSGNVHDAKVMDRLVRDDDTAVYGDKGYASDAKKRVPCPAGPSGAVLLVSRKNYGVTRSYTPLEGPQKKPHRLRGAKRKAGAPRGAIRD
jgi:hypothetical protein